MAEKVTATLAIQPSPFSDKCCTRAYAAGWNACLEEFGKDAQRYRWIREHDAEGAICEPIQKMWANCKTLYPSPDEWDAAIDSQIAAERARTAVTRGGEES